MAKVGVLLLGLAICFAGMFRLVSDQEEIRNTPTFKVNGIIQSIRAVAEKGGRYPQATYYVKIKDKEYAIKQILWNDHKVGQTIQLTGNQYSVLSVEVSAQ